MPRASLPPAVAPDQLARALESDPSVRLLDVRTAREFAASRLTGSHNVPLGELAAHAAAIGGVRAPVVLVCRSGARARTAEQLLRGQGMTNLHVLEGGIVAWRRGGLPVVSDPGAAGDTVRRVMGFGGVVLAAFYLRQNAVLAMLLGFMGVRMMMGQSVLPCAVAGTCAVPGRDTAASVRALVDGPAAGPVSG